MEQRQQISTTISGNWNLTKALVVIGVDDFLWEQHIHDWIWIDAVNNRWMHRLGELLEKLICRFVAWTQKCTEQCRSIYEKKHNARYDVVSMSVIIRHGFDKTVSETMLNIAITTSTNETSCILGLAIGLYLPESIFW